MVGQSSMLADKQLRLPLVTCRYAMIFGTEDLCENPISLQLAHLFHSTRHRYPCPRTFSPTFSIPAAPRGAVNRSFCGSDIIDQWTSLPGNTCFPFTTKRSGCSATGLRRSDALQGGRCCTMKPCSTLRTASMGKRSSISDAGRGTFAAS